MAWGFRKSVGFGGLRFTFSKSGVSTSFGGRGFRVTSGPRGVYVTTGAGGFYYRQRIGGRAQQLHRRTAPVAPRAPGSSFAPTTTYESADVGVLSDVSQADFVVSLNEWTHRGVLQLIFGAASSMIVLVSLAVSPVAALEALLYSAVIFSFVRFIEQRRRRFVLVYDLTGDASAAFAQFENSLEPLCSSWVRGVQASQYHGDWKHHGGATTSIRGREASITHATPPLIVSNLTPISLSTSASTLFFLPDRILVRSNGTYAALSYESLQADWHEGRFVWDDWALPPGAEVTERTWLYTNRSGGPDRRFNNNRELPVIRMAYLVLGSESGLKLVIQSTNIEAVRNASEALGRFARDRSADISHEASSQPPAVIAALRALGLVQLPSKHDLRKHYLDLAQRTHPDKLGQADRDVRVLAEHRMKEINAAYATLRDQAKGPPVPDERDEIPQQTTSTSLVWWQEPTTRASVAAVLGCVLVFAVFRALPAQQMISSNAVSRAAVPQPTTSVITKIPRACTVRSEPSVQSTALMTLQPGAGVSVTETANSWRKIRTPDGRDGWTGPACWRALRARGQACRSNEDCESFRCNDDNGPRRICR
jgi:hypothetical protein